MSKTYVALQLKVNSQIDVHVLNRSCTNKKKAHNHFHTQALRGFSSVMAKGVLHFVIKGLVSPTLLQTALELQRLNKLGTQ